MNHRFKILFKRYKDHTATPEEQMELFELIQSDEYDHALLDDINNTLSDTRPGLLYTADPIKEETFDRIARDQELPTSRVPFMRWLAVAASLLLVAVTGLWLFYSRPWSAADELRYTHKGMIVLPDGTQVTLNDNSELSYFTEGMNRIVTLRGEAFFDVVHDARHPFIVQTGKIRTRVLGTAFNVRAYTKQKEVQVTVERGVVEVGEEDRAYAQIKKDEQITVDTQTTQYHKAEVDVHQATAWKDDGFSFDDMTLEDAVVLIEQRYHFTLVFTNPALRSCRMSGSFSSQDDLAKVVSVICGMAGAECRIDDTKRQVTITGGSCQ